MCVVEHKLVTANVMKQQSDVPHTFLLLKKSFVHLYQSTVEETHYVQIVIKKVEISELVRTTSNLFELYARCCI